MRSLSSGRAVKLWMRTESPGLSSHGASENGCCAGPGIEAVALSGPLAVVLLVLREFLRVHFPSVTIFEFNTFLITLHSAFKI